MKLDKTGMFVFTNDDINKILDVLSCISDDYVSRIVTNKSGSIIQILVEFDSYHKKEDIKNA